MLWIARVSAIFFRHMTKENWSSATGTPSEVFSRVTSDPIHLLYFVGLIQGVGRNAS